MTLLHQFEYASTKLVLGLCRILPRFLIYVLFRFFARAFYFLSARRRNITLCNLKIAFPEKPLAERKKWAKESYVNLGDSMAFNMLVMTGRVSNQELLDSVEIEGWEHIQEAKDLAGGKGVLFYSAHIGNWELLSQVFALNLSQNIHVVTRETTNPLLEKNIVQPLRERFGINVHYKKNALLRIVKVIKKGDFIGFLIDHKVKPPEGIYLPFFGKDAPTLASPALLQIRFNIIISSLFMIKLKVGKYKFIINPPLKWEDNGKPQEEQIIELTKIHQKVITDLIRQYPQQWFWMHNRWGLKKDEL